MSQPYSPQFIQNRKMAVMLPVFVVPFLAIIFFLFGGGTPKASGPEPASGLNTSIPPPADKPAVDSKVEAYKLADQQQQQDQQLRSLENFPVLPGDTTSTLAGENTGGLALTPGPQHESPQNETLEALNQKVGAYYQSSSGASLSEEKLDRLIALLEQRQEASLPPGGSIGNHPYLRYLERELTSGTFSGEKPKRDTASRPARRQTLEVASHQPRLVHKLTQAARPRTAARHPKNAFYSLDASAGPEKSNTVSAVIHQDQTLVDGSTVKLRLLSDINLKGTLVPRSAFIYGVAALRNERLMIFIENVRYGKEILPVNLQAYDTDGMPGVYIPGSVNREAGKQALEQATAGGSHQVTLSQGVKEQLAMQAAQTGIAGIRHLAARKARTPKVHVKANYRVYLKP